MVFMIIRLPVWWVAGVFSLVLGNFTWPHAWAVQPDEVLTDHLLETRARTISRALRCPICQGESIDDSNAPISRDLRLLVRERLLAGDSDAEVKNYIVARYGEFVLFSPRIPGVSILLWVAGPIVFFVGFIVVFFYLRRRSSFVGQEGRNVPEAGRVEALSFEEQARLEALLKKEE